MKTPLVSIILPTYNRANLLESCINSVLAQSYLNWELIISDDGSLDNTATLAQKFEKLDSRIRYYRNPVKQGLPKNRNIAISKAKGDLIFFIEDDVELEANTVELLVKAFLKLKERGETPGAIAPWLIEEVDEKERQGPLNFNDNNLPEPYIVSRFTGLIYQNFYKAPSQEVIPSPTLHSCALIPIEIFKRGFFFEERLYKGHYSKEETDFYFRLRKSGYNLYLIRDAKIHHKRAKEGGCRIPLGASIFYFFRNHLIFLLRFYRLKSFYMVPLFFFAIGCRILIYLWKRLANES